MTDLSALLDTRFLDNSILQWGIALLAFLVTFTILPLVRGYVRTLRKRYAATTHPIALEIVSLFAERTRVWFLWALAIWIAETLLVVPRKVDRVFEGAIVVLTALQVGMWAHAAVGYLLHHRRGVSQDADLTGSLAIVNFVAGVAIWALVLLLALDNLGVNITALVAGLGIGGIAVALALQAVLGDLLASLSIALDKPFIVGDVLTFGGATGKVEKIGISSTRLRSVDGEQIIVANADLLKARIHNYGRMFERRVLFRFGVAYDTPRAKLEKIPGLVEEAVREHDKTRFERSHFVAFGDYALQFETVYFVLDADYQRYADIQQAINLDLHEEFARLGVQFALSTERRTLEQSSSQ
jgi:small-conductance mechanosensitive channel